MGGKRPDGVRLEWETAQVGAEPNGTFFPFLIHDFTPREQRAFPQGKPLNKDFGGVAKVVIAVHDLDASAKRYSAGLWHASADQAGGSRRSARTWRCWAARQWFWRSR